MQKEGDNTAGALPPCGCATNRFNGVFLLGLIEVPLLHAGPSRRVLRLLGPRRPKRIAEQGLSRCALVKAPRLSLPIRSAILFRITARFYS